MANTEGPEGQPAAWVWSQYRGVAPADPPSGEAAAQAPAASAAAPAAKNMGMIGLGVAAAVIVIAGLTWLFATKPASAPADSTPPAATEAPAEPQKSEAAPPPAPAADAAPAPAPAATQEAPKPAEPAHEAEHGKKKKKHK